MRAKRQLTGLAWLLFLLYVAVLLKLVLFKHSGTLSFQVGHFSLGTHPSGRMVEEISLGRLLFRLQYAANFVPFKTIADYLSGDFNKLIALWNIGGNIVLFGPLGLLVPLILPRFSKVRHIAAIAFGASLLLELVQLLTGLGSFDVDDLLLNVLGGILGVLTVRVARRVIAATVK
jgi:glycopeptide antibiotics resistance protein